MNSFNKISSNESGPFNNVKNTFNITIPNDTSTIIPSSSSLVLTVDNPASRLLFLGDVTDPQADNKGLAKFILASVNQPESNVINTDFIKNLRITSSSKGLIEELRNVNVNQKILSTYVNSLENSEGKGIVDVYASIDPQLNINTPFNEISSIENTISYDRPTQLEIKLKNLCGLGLLDTLDLNYTGDLNFRFDVEDTLLLQNLTIFNPIDKLKKVICDVLDPNILAQLVLTSYLMSDLNSALDPAPAPADEKDDFYLGFLNAKTAFPNFTHIVDLTGDYRHPFYIGMPIEVTFGNVDDVGQPSKQANIITNIIINYTEKSLKFTFLTDFVIVQGQDSAGNPVPLDEVFDIKFYNEEDADRPIPPPAKNPLVSADMIVKKSAQSVKGSGYEILTYDTEIDGFAISDNRINTYLLKPQTQAVLITSIALTTKEPRFTEGDEYAISIDNVRTTTEDVFLNSGLYLEKLNQGFTAMNMPLKNILSKLSRPANPDGQKLLISNLDNYVISEPIVVKNTIQNLELNVKSTVNLTNIIVYKYYNKVF